MFAVRPRGAIFKINPLRWYNGHPGEHTTSFHVSDPSCVEWLEDEYGMKRGKGLSDCTFSAECTTPSGVVYKTQNVKITIVEDYVGNQYV